MSNFILGGGISGLICAYYNPSYTIISKNIGGQLKSPFPLGPQYLHYTPEIEELLMELKLPITTKEVKIGYYYKGKYITPKDSHQREYWLKTRDRTGFQETCMMGRRDSFEAFTVSPKELAEALSLRVRNKILAEAYQVDLSERKILCWEGEFKYDKLISTVPLPVFLKLANKSGALSWKDVYFEYAQTKKDGILHRILWQEGKEFDFIYFPWIGVEFYRITKLEEPFCVLEYTHIPSYKAYEIEVVKTHVLKYAKIISGSSEEVEKLDENLKFVGRYAKWDSKYFVHHAIKEAKKIAHTGSLC
jgi:hypothetical protein